MVSKYTKSAYILNTLPNIGVRLLNWGIQKLTSPIVSIRGKDFTNYVRKYLPTGQNYVTDVCGNWNVYGATAGLLLHLISRQNEAFKRSPAVKVMKIVLGLGYTVSTVMFAGAAIEAARKGDTGSSALAAGQASLDGLLAIQYWKEASQRFPLQGQP